MMPAWDAAKLAVTPPFRRRAEASHQVTCFPRAARVWSAHLSWLTVAHRP